MAREWPRVTLGSISDTITKGTTPTTIGHSFSDSGINFIKSECLTYEGTIDSSKFAFVSPEAHQAMKRSQIKANDILMSMAGVYLGKVAIVPGEYTPANTNQAVAIIRLGRSDISHRFVAYCLRTPSMRRNIVDGVAQSAQPNINLADIGNLTIPLPPFKEQQAIACILGTLDDKIELNRRMNQTLEEMARAIFKSWFVDFDPVRAKAGGQQPPGLKPEIAALFPDAFQGSELGEIPMGWRVGKLGDIAYEVRDAISSCLIEPNTAYIALEHIPKRCLALDSWAIAEGVTSGKLRFRRGDILFGKLRPYFHKVGPTPIDGVCSTDIVVARPRHQYWYGLVIGHMSDDEFVAHTDRSSTGTKMPRTNWRDMASYAIPLPSAELAKLYNNLLHPMLVKMQTAIMQYRTLADLRDGLLPKLISGELRVPDAERIVGRCP